MPLWGVIKIRHGGAHLEPCSQDIADTARESQRYGARLSPAAAGGTATGRHELNRNDAVGIQRNSESLREQETSRGKVAKVGQRDIKDDPSNIHPLNSDALFAC